MEEFIMRNKKETILIFTAELARRLLKEGYMITDIKPHRNLANASVFVFRNEDGLMDKVKRFSQSK